MVRRTTFLAGVAGSAAFDAGSYLLQVETEYEGPTPSSPATPAPTGSGATPAPTLAGVPCDCYSCWDSPVKIDLDGDGNFTPQECNLSAFKHNCINLFTSPWDVDGDGGLNKTEFKAVQVAYPAVCKPPPPPDPPARCTPN
jgi:hypothetical protein